MTRWHKIGRVRSSKTTPARRERRSDNIRGVAHVSAGDIERDGNTQGSFRRNRTLSRPVDRSSPGLTQRVASHQLRRKRRSIGWLLLGSIGVVVTVGALVYQLTADVAVSLHGSLDELSDANQANYSRTIDEYFARRPLERLRGLMHAEGLSEYLQQHGHNEVESVMSIEFAGVGRTMIKLEAREPVARWIIDKKVQFVDKSGNIFTNNYYSTPHIKIVDKSGITISDNQTATSGRFLGFIGMSIGALEASEHKVREVVIPPSTTRQVQLRTSKGTLVRMAIDRPVGEQVEDASRALSHLTKKNKAASYIDVRVGNKAYYK